MITKNYKQAQNYGPLFEDYRQHQNEVENKMLSEVVNVNPTSLKRIHVTFCTRKEIADGESVTLADALIRLPQAYKERIDAVRDTFADELAEGKDHEGSTAMKKALPVWYPGGVFCRNHAKTDLTDFSGLICVDIDGKDNPRFRDTESMKDVVAKMDFVIYCGLSCRGNGLFAVIALPYDAKKGTNYEDYFRALREEFAEAGLVVDDSCSNINRSRFLSYDDEPIWNTHARIWTKKKEKPAYIPTTESKPISKRNLARATDIVEQCEEGQIDLSDDNAKTWYAIAVSLANTFGESGRDLFLRLSNIWCQATGKEQREDPGEKYSAVLKKPGLMTDAYFFSLAQKHDVLCRI